MNEVLDPITHGDFLVLHTSLSFLSGGGGYISADISKKSIGGFSLNN
jgi:hypothetical protein